MTNTTAEDSLTTHTNSDAPVSKKCVSCDEIKIVDEFNKKTKHKDGLENICKSCQKIRNREAYLRSKTRTTTTYATTASADDSLGVKHPDIIPFWADDNSINVDMISPGSSYVAKLACPVCSYTWERSITNIVRGFMRNSGICPVCSDTKTVAGWNDAATSHPEWVEFFSATNDFSLSQVSSKSRKMAVWKCVNGHSYNKRVKAFTGNDCPECELVSKSVTFIAPYLVEEWSENNELTPEQVSYNSARIIDWVCKECAHEWSTPLYQRVNSQTGCPKCAESSQTSRAEIEIFEWLEKTLPNTRIIRNDRTVLGGKEIDIYFPDHNFGIEYNGLYWHQESRGRSKDYHSDKWNAAATAGVQLYTVWEDDWHIRPNVIRANILYKLGFGGGVKVFARKTQVVEIDYQTSADFLNTHHIQGAATGSSYFGLQDKNTGLIVAVSVWEKQGSMLLLERYATAGSVPGGMGKLLKYATNYYHTQIDAIITFAAHDVSDGGLYVKTGFVADKILPPDYMYVVRGVRVHKFNYRKNRFKNDPDLLWEDGLTESELAVLNGLSRVYDSGKTRYKIIL